MEKIFLAIVMFTTILIIVAVIVFGVIGTALVTYWNLSENVIPKCKELISKFKERGSYALYDIWAEISSNINWWWRLNKTIIIFCLCTGIPILVISSIIFYVLFFKGWGGNLLPQ